jgi:uncharacterized protein YecT (DUF1311 family)
MKKSRLLASFVFGLAAFGPLEVGRAQSQAEMNQMALNDLGKSDDRLNRVYKALLRERAKEKEFCADLREAQRAWLRYVEFHLKSIFTLNEGEVPTHRYGSIYLSEYAETKQAMIERRIAELEELRQRFDAE